MKIKQHPKRRIEIVIAGGNYAGLNVLHHLYSGLLADGAPGSQTSTSEFPDLRITLIDRRDGFLHLIGMTRGLIQRDYGEQLWIPYKDIPWLRHPQIRIVQGVIVGIDPVGIRVCSHEEQFHFDYLVMALGQARFGPVGVGATTKEQFVKDINVTQNEIHMAKTVIVVGGGPVGVEIAADIKCHLPQTEVTLVHSRPRLIPGPFSDEFRDQVADILQHEIGVNVILGDRAIDHDPPTPDMVMSQSSTSDMTMSQSSMTDMMRKPTSSFIECTSASGKDVTVTLTSGRVLSADWVIRCLGAYQRFPFMFLLPSKDGCATTVNSDDDIPSICRPNGIRVKSTMQVDGSACHRIFAVGDVCNRYDMKLAGVAMYGGYIAARNIIRMIFSLMESTSESGEKLELAEFQGDIAEIRRDNEGEVDKEMGSQPLCENCGRVMIGYDRWELENAREFPAKLLLLMGREHYACQMGDEVWSREQTRQYVDDDMGLEKCIKALSLHETPKFQPILPKPMVCCDCCVK